MWEKEVAPMTERTKVAEEKRRKVIALAIEVSRVTGTDCIDCQERYNNHARPMRVSSQGKHGSPPIPHQTDS